MTDRKRTTAIQVRVTEREKRKLERQAAYTGMNPPRARRISARLPEKICHPTGRVRQ